MTVIAPLSICDISTDGDSITSWKKDPTCAPNLYYTPFGPIHTVSKNLYFSRYLIAGIYLLDPILKVKPLGPINDNG